MWPRLDAEYLDAGQLEHEVFIRNIPVSPNALGVYSLASLKVIQKEISSDPYNPLAIGHLRVDSPEERARQHVEFTRCKVGLCALDSKTQTLDSYTLVQRAMHFLFRLERLNLLPVGDIEKKMGLRKKARNLINHYCPLTNVSNVSNTETRNETLIDLEGESDKEENATSAQNPSPVINTEKEVESHGEQT